MHAAENGFFLCLLPWGGACSTVYSLCCISTIPDTFTAEYIVSVVSELLKTIGICYKVDCFSVWRNLLHALLKRPVQWNEEMKYDAIYYNKTRIFIFTFLYDIWRYTKFFWQKGDYVFFWRKRYDIVATILSGLQIDTLNLTGLSYIIIYIHLSDHTYLPTYVQFLYNIFILL